jgi:hypothetical protein
MIRLLKGGEHGFRRQNRVGNRANATAFSLMFIGTAAFEA